jgi:hypothetical protein
MVIFTLKEGERLLMNRASTGEVMKLIHPFVHTKFLAVSYVNFEDVGKIKVALSPFENVSVKLKDKHDGYAYLVIRISRTLTGKKLEYELRDHNRRKKIYDDLGWIDAIEGYDALFHD